MITLFCLVLRDIGKDIALFEGFQTQPLVFMVRMVFMVEMSVERWWNGVYSYSGKPMYSLLGEKSVPGLCQGFLRIRRFLLFQYHFANAPQSSSC